MPLGPGEYYLIALLVCYSLVIPLLIKWLTGEDADGGSLVLTMPIGIFGPGIIIQSGIDGRYFDTSWQLVVVIASFCAIYWIGTQIKSSIYRAIDARVEADIEKARHSLAKKH